MEDGMYLDQFGHRAEHYGDGAQRSQRGGPDGAHVGLAHLTAARYDPHPPASCFSLLLLLKLLQFGFAVVICRGNHIAQRPIPLLI